jgi:hypothetical protein
MSRDSRLYLVKMYRMQMHLHTTMSQLGPLRMHAGIREETKRGSEERERRGYRAHCAGRVESEVRWSV